MDSIFGIGTPELILILLIAGIVMGPERIGRAARWLGRTTAQLQAISRGFVRQLNAELEQADEGGELKSAMQDVQDLRRQLAELRGEITSVAANATRESQKTYADIENQIRPPQHGKDDAADRMENGRSAPAQDSSESTTLFSPAELPKRVDVPDDPER